MGRRRSDIRRAIKRALWELKGEFIVCFRHRSETGERIKCIEGRRIVAEDQWAIHLDDDTSIPYHRILEIRSTDGTLLWSRKEGLWSSHPDKSRETGDDKENNINPNTL